MLGEFIREKINKFCKEAYEHEEHFNINMMLASITNDILDSFNTNLIADIEIDWDEVEVKDYLKNMGCAVDGDTVYVEKLF